MNTQITDFNEWTIISLHKRKWDFLKSLYSRIWAFNFDFIDVCVCLLEFDGWKAHFPNPCAVFIRDLLTSPNGYMSEIASIMCNAFDPITIPISFMTFNIDAMFNRHYCALASVMRAQNYKNGYLSASDGIPVKGDRYAKYAIIWNWFFSFLFYSLSLAM